MNNPIEDFDWEAYEKSTESTDMGISNCQTDGNVIEGTVIALNKREVVVNIGYKCNGIIPMSEFRYNPDIKVGDVVEVFIENQEDKKCQLILSHKKARASRSWDRVNAALNNDEVIKGFIKCRTKGGMIVDVFGIEAFLPGSQIDVKPIRDYDVFVGKTMEFKVVKINEEFKNVVVSRKALIEAELEQQKREIISKLEKGQVLEGTVKNITSYGAFIDLGGVDGLIHITDLSWGRISHPEEVVELDQKLNVIILDIDEEKRRIALGLKQLLPNPTKIKVGTILTGSIKKVEDRYLIIQFTGFSALAPKGEMTERDFAEGDNFTGVVTENVYDEEKRRNKIIVSERVFSEIFAESHSVGSRVFARVENINNTDGKLEVLVKCGNLLVYVPQKRFIEPYKTQLTNGDLAIGSELEFEYTKYLSDHRLIVLDMRPIEIARKIEDRNKKMQEKQERINTLLQQLKKGDIVNAEVISVNDKIAKVKVEGTDVICTIPRDELSPNKVLRASDEVFIGEIIQIAFLGYEEGELLFSRRFFVENRYDESLYDLSLMEVLESMGIHTNRFIGKAIEISGNYFLSQLMSVAEVGSDDNGLLLVDPQNGQNLIAIVDNRLRNFIIPDNFYEVRLDLARKEYRKEQGTPYQFCITSNDIKERINPYEESVSLTFKKLNSPSANKSLSYLLEEVGIGLYRSKKRMFFELLQNADDAASNNGVKVKIQVNGEYFVLTHDGYSFNKHDFYSITSAAQSTKSANKKKTGYKGIGFKSVFTNSSTVIIKSGGYVFSFDKSYSLFNDFKKFYFLSNGIENDPQRQIEFLQQNEQEYRRFNGVQEIPWQLLPIWTNDVNLSVKDSIFNSKENVAIALKMDEHIIQDYGDAIKEIFEEPRFMLFLRRTKRIQLKIDELWFTIQKNILDNGKTVTLVNSFSEKSRAEYYKIITVDDIVVSDEAFANAGIPIRKAERINNRGDKESFFVRIGDDGSDGPEIAGVPDRIASADNTELSFAIELNQNGGIRLIDIGNSSFYAYLPMNEQRFSFPFYINADFIPNSNREEINTESPWNAYLFYCIGESIVRMVVNFASGNNPDYLLLLPNKELDTNSVETSLLSNAFNRAYTTALENEAFILNDLGSLSKQCEVIIDNSELSDYIENNVFLDILGTTKRLVSSNVDATILKKPLFARTEHVESSDILDKLQERDDLKEFCKSLSEEDYNGFLKWLYEIGDKQEVVLPHDIVNNLPCFSDGENVLSFNELDANNSIILTDKTISVQGILKKIGFVVYEIISPVTFNFSLPSEKEVFIKISGWIESRKEINLNAEEKLTLFNLFMSFEGVAEGTCAGIKLFKNVCGVAKPLNEMLTYRDNAPEWLHPYMICTYENFDEIQSLLIENKDEFEKVVWKNIDNIHFSPIEIIKGYSIEGEGLRKFIDRCKSDEDLEVLLPVIVGSGEKTETHFINKITKIELKDGEHYSKESFTYKVLLLVLANCDKPSEFSKKIFYNGICITEFSVKDEVICKYSENGVEKQAKMSLAILLPQYQDQSESIEKIKSLFEVKKDLDKFFEAKSLPNFEIAKVLESAECLGLKPGFWPSGKGGNPYQYLFYVHYYRAIKGYTSTYVISINLEDETDEFISGMLDFLYKYNVDIRTSPFTYRLQKYFLNKSLNNDYVFADECVLPSIDNWADSVDKRNYLFRNGVINENSNYILLRRLFVENKPVDFVSNMSDSDVFAALNFFSNVEGMIYPFVGVNQIEVLQQIKSRRNSPIIERVDIDKLSDKSLEWDNPEYIGWKVDHYPSIFLFNGKMPHYFEHNGEKLMIYSEKDYCYDCRSQTLYINSRCNIDDLLFEIAREGKSGLNLDDYQELCRKGKISVSEETIKAKDDKIAFLEREIERLKSNGSEVENPGLRYGRGNLTTEQRKQVNIDACEQAYNYLSTIEGYDCSEWDYSTEGRVVKSVLYKERRIVVVITSSGGGYIYLNPYAFAQLMENPENLLINVCGNIVRTYSFKELFEDNQDVNLIFDTNVVTPENFAELANKFMTSERTCFVIANPNYSASDEIKGFGLSEKMEGGNVITFSFDDQIW